MTNQQGAPEALRLAESLERRTTSWPEKCFAAYELRRLHAENERLAALVDAQQAATHVQNPAEIEHVAGDVSKNGAESDMAPQPSPPAQADSQPAPTVGTIAHVGTGKTALTGAITSALRAASTEADSVTAPAGGAAILKEILQPAQAADSVLEDAALLKEARGALW